MLKWLVLAAILLAACNPAPAGSPTPGAVNTAEPAAGTTARATALTTARATAAVSASPSPRAAAATPPATTGATAVFTPVPTATPAGPPPGLGGRYRNERLGYALPYPDGWNSAEVGNRTGFAQDAERARAPDFSQGSGAFVRVFKRESLALSLGRTDVTPAEAIAQVLRFDLPAAPAGARVTPLVYAGYRAAETYVDWLDAGGTRVAAYVLAVEAGSREIAFVAGLPAETWPDGWPPLRAMAARLSVADLDAPPGASEGGSLEAGGSASARLGLVPQAYTFEGQVGDYVTLAALAGPSTDPAVALYDPEGRRITADDDSGTGLGAVISSAPLEQAGTYRAVVWSMGASGGDYTLQLYSSETPSGGGPLRTGESVVGTLAFTGVRHEWTFAGRAGRAVAASVTRVSGDAQVLLAVIAPGGQTLAQVHGDAAGGASLAELPILRYDTYTLVVQALQGSGDYRVQVDELPQASGGGAADFTTGSVQESGSLAPDAYQAWDVSTLAEPAQLALQARSGTAELEMRTPGGELLAWTRSDLGAASLPAPACPCRLLVHGLPVHGSAALDYTLRYRPVAPPTPLAPELQPDMPLKGTLEAGLQLATMFEGGAGKAVRITLDGDDSLGAYLAVRAPDGSRIAFALSTRGDLLLPELPTIVSGTYSVELGAYAGQGPFALLLNDVSAESGGGLMIYGDSAFGTLAPYGQHAWRFDAAAGDTLAVSVRRGTGNLSPVVVLYSQTGTRLARAQADAEGNVSFGPLPLRENGRYTIIVYGQGATSGDYEIDIQ